MMQQDRSGRCGGWQVTLLLGGGLILLAEVLLAIDVGRRGGIVVPSDQPLPAPVGWLGQLARWMAVNMTVVCWIGYLLVMDGWLGWLTAREKDAVGGEPTHCNAWASGERGGHPIRARPNRFVFALLTSMPIWCFFDWVNFYLMDAWRYHGLPLRVWQRHGGYLIAFAAISPAMLLAAHGFQRIGVQRLQTDSPQQARTIAWWLLLGVSGLLAGVSLGLLALGGQAVQSEAGVPSPLAGIAGWLISAGLLVLPGFLIAVLTRRMGLTMFAIGLGFTAWSMLVAAPVGNLTLWVGLIFLLDPINRHVLGQPSIVADWQAGRWGRMVSLMLGGALCGLLWEFWNYWAIAKWTYHLPFLGSLASVRYFEMPVVGFLGFLPFAVECWVMLQTLIGLLAWSGLRVAEPLPTPGAVL